MSFRAKSLNYDLLIILNSHLFPIKFKKCISSIHVISFYSFIPKTCAKHSMKINVRIFLLATEFYYAFLRSLPSVPVTLKKLSSLMIEIRNVILFQLDRKLK